MAKGRKGNRGYKPLSNNFCNSIIKSSQNKNNLNTDIDVNEVIYNKDKSAKIYKVFNTSDKIPTGYRIESKDVTFDIDINRRSFDAVIEILHFNFEFKDIKKFLHIKEREEQFKTKDFVSMKDFLFVLSIVPFEFLRSNDVLHYMKTVPVKVLENDTVDSLMAALNITKEQAERCIQIYQNKDYNSILEDAKKKVNSSKMQTEDTEMKGVSELKNVVEVQDGSVEQIEDTNQIVLQNQVKNESIEVDTVVDTENGDENIFVTDLVEPIQLEKNEEELDNSQNIKRRRKVITLEDYQKLLGFDGISFDFESLSNDLKTNLKNMSFTEYIEKENKSGISDLLYILLHYNRCYNYSYPFYPAEDKILELYYKEIGKRVVELMKLVIPDYKERPEYEYLYRIYEKKYKTCHPIMGFNYTKEDIDIISKLYSKVKKSLTKYFFWMDLQNVLYISYSQNIETVSPSISKKCVDVQNIDIDLYVQSAQKLKEVIYHNEYWTSDKHEIFKDEFKQVGLGVLDKIADLTKDEALNHSKQYKIYQNYTDAEVEKLKKVYLSEGFEGLFKAFPYRTENALRYKVEEEGWEEERNSILREKQIEEEVSKRVEIEKGILSEEIRKQILEEELKNYEAQLTEKLMPELREKVLSEFSNILLGSVFENLKEEIPQIIKMSSLSDLPNNLPSNIISKLNEKLKIEVQFLNA